VRHAIVGPSVLPQYRADAMLTKRFGASSPPVGRVGLTKSPWKMTFDQCGINPDQPVVTVSAMATRRSVVRSQRAGNGGNNNAGGSLGRVGA